MAGMSGFGFSRTASFSTSFFGLPAASANAVSQLSSSRTGASSRTAVRLSRPSANISITTGYRRATRAAVFRL